MDEEFEKGSGPKRFEYGQLSVATNGFSEEEKLGEGGLGAVYRRFLREVDLHVAIREGVERFRAGEERVHLEGEDHKPAAASEPCSAHRLVPPGKGASYCWCMN
jgi:hypothetical protein